MEQKPGEDMVPAGQPHKVNPGRLYTNGWSDLKKWIMSLISCIVVSAIVGWGTAQIALRSEVKEGQAVFDNIGLRYFDALLGAHDLQTGKPSAKQEDWEAYRRILDDLQKDIRWLRTNPLYGRIQRDTQDLVFVQNRLVTEAVGEALAAGDSALYFMCKVFVESGEWGKTKTTDKDAVTNAVHDFANLNCQHVLNPVTGEQTDP